MSSETTITIIGNITADPELRYTPSGQPAVTFRVASTPRTYDKASGEWRDGEALFLTVTAWRQLAENAAESLRRGMRVVVQGALRQRSYETRDGEKRTVYEVQAEEIAASIRFAAVTVRRTERNGSGQGQPQGAAAGNGQFAGDAPPF
ncbi:MAG TPA: single-stranded DNA-binding protein [Streptosporangiaceae bacterium]|nr:single-stranded DNA-binding protein [Streptosporangiaceae bacterium]